ncbi:DUF2163 domain-containing protein [Segnochrobactraceae bacterium EtOH-i3]
MKTFSAAFSARLAAGATTFCRCWRIERSDGVILGVTDHDRPITLGDTLYEPGDGAEATADVAGADFAVGGLDLSGALSASGLDAADLAAGRYDGARIELRLVDWTDPDIFALLRVGTLGEVTLSDGAYRAEVRGPAEALSRVTGRTLTLGCDAEVGDDRCGVDLSQPAFSATGTVLADLGEGRLTVDGLSGFAEGWFTFGWLTVTDGAAAGFAAAIKRQGSEDDGAAVDLWSAAPVSLLGAGVRLTAGCARTWEVCQSKFANGDNFRGCPHIPGNDVALWGPDPDGGNDGGSLFA